MKYDLFENVSKQQEAMMATMQKLNKLAVGNVEKLVSIQMSSLRNYSDLSVQQLKDLTEVRTPQQLQEYFTKQTDSAKVLAEKALADAKVAAELGVEFNKEAQKISQDSFAAVTKKAA